MDCPIGEICRTWIGDRDVVRCIQQHGGATDPCFGHELLASRYRRQLLEQAYQRLHSWDDAEDCVQEALLNALRGIDSFRCECAVSTWLWRIVTRTCIDHLRAERGHREEHLLTEFHPQQECEGCPLCDAHDLTTSELDEVVIATAERHAMQQALQDLPESLREILSDHYLAGEPWKDMALRLGMDAKTLRIRRHRAKRLLKAMLERTGWA